MSIYLASIFGRSALHANILNKWSDITISAILFQSFKLVAIDTFDVCSLLFIDSLTLTVLLRCKRKYWHKQLLPVMRTHSNYGHHDYLSIQLSSIYRFMIWQCEIVGNEQISIALFACFVKVKIICATSKQGIYTDFISTKGYSAALQNIDQDSRKSNAEKELVGSWSTPHSDAFPLAVEFSKLTLDSVLLSELFQTRRVIKHPANIEKSPENDVL